MARDLKVENGRILEQNPEVDYAELAAERDALHAEALALDIKIKRIEQELAKLEVELADLVATVALYDSVLALYEEANPDDPDVVARLAQPQLPDDLPPAPELPDERPR